VPRKNFEMRLLGMFGGNDDSSVASDVNVSAQQTKRESQWSKGRQAEHPEELKTWHGQLDVVNPDGPAPAVQGEYSRLRQSPSSQAPGRGQLRLGMDWQHGSFGEDRRDFQQEWSRRTVFAVPARLRSGSCDRTDGQDKEPVRGLADELKGRMRQDADYTSI
jgi:hypothetical protein